MADTETVPTSETQDTSWQAALSKARSSLENNEQEVEDREAAPEPGPPEGLRDETDSTPDPAEIGLVTTGDQPQPGPASQQAEATRASKESAEEPTGDREFLSKKDIEKLSKENSALGQLANSLTKWRSSLTRESQKLAEQRKEFEALTASQEKPSERPEAPAVKDADFEEWKPFITEFQRDPQEAIRLAASHYGITLDAGLTRGNGEQAPAPSLEAPPFDPRLQAMIQKRLTDQLGDESVANALSAPMIESATMVAQQIVNEALTPFHAQMHEQEARRQHEITQAAHEEFTTNHPDWQKYESDMTQLAQKLLVTPKGEFVAPNLDPLSFMELLYGAVTKDKGAAQEAKKLIERQNRGAREAETSASRGVSPANVSKKPPKNASFRQAYDAAKRGERW